MRCRDIAPGVYVQEDRWTALDVELRRAQDAETRLDAENKSLRQSANAWHPGWKSLAVVLALGLAGGAYAGWRLSE